MVHCATALWLHPSSAFSSFQDWLAANLCLQIANVRDLTKLGFPMIDGAHPLKLGSLLSNNLTTLSLSQVGAQLALQAAVSGLQLGTLALQLLGLALPSLCMCKLAFQLLDPLG